MKPLPVIELDSPAQPASDSQTAGMVADPENTRALTPQIVAALSTVFDPEIPINIYELGLVYDVIVDASKAVGIRMTLTAPGCPVAQVLPAEVARKIREIDGVTDAKVDIVWDPPWDRDRMSDAAKLQLGMF